MVRARIPVMVLLFSAAAAMEAISLSSLSAIGNSDVWWHLSSGLWMLQNHALPRTGIFSQAAGTAWIASSWIYDLLVAFSYRLVGLRAIPLLLMGFKTTLAVVTFLLAGGLRRNFWPAVALSAVAQYVLGALPPGPTYASVLFFGLELLLLFESRRRQRWQLLLWLPALMLLWANVDPQFVIGVAVLVLFLASLWCEQYLFSGAHPVEVGKIATIACVAVLCTVVTPYFYHPYGVFFGVTFSSANAYLPDFHALGFRQPQDYVLLLLAMSAFLGLGLRRSRDLFSIALLAASMAAAFYSQRNIWLVAMAAVAVMGQTLRVPVENETSNNIIKRPEARNALVVSLIVVVIAAWAIMPRSREALLARIGKSYPVGACDSIRQQHLAQPLFNAYEWGGFVTWYLPQYPVAIDGRSDLYGADVITEYSKMMNADVPYTEYAAVSGAQTILLPKRAIMAGALSSLPIFKVVYSDDLAVVLSRRSGDE
ncbi:MAG TPA: hypothetical protein VKQ11_17530 [Candidatus Sulfotelmatobacter sp.]|nr:hypothetical protein [Candidatus Sulfotelmatobacter sp.]